MGCINPEDMEVDAVPTPAPAARVRPDAPAHPAAEPFDPAAVYVNEYAEIDPAAAPVARQLQFEDDDDVPMA
jgi:hypothetical protein